jgi:outer membrane protein
MRRKLILASLCVSLALTFTWLSAGLVSADILEEVLSRTGYVNLDTIFNSYERTQDLQAGLDAQRQQEIAQMEEMRQNLEQMNKEYQAQEMLLSEDAKKERQAEINQKIKAYEDFRQSCSERMQSQLDSYTKQILDDIKAKIHEVAKRDGYVYIFHFDTSQVIDPAVVLLYAAPPAKDLTEVIVEELNAGYEPQSND